MKALYRKYRPKSLSEVVGQDKVVSVLKNSIDQNNISHAYLFTGPRGTGKTSVARIFAHEINHFPYELEDNYVDIIEIDAASNTGVDNIRDLRERAVIAPTKGKYKVYIIDEVHMLSKSAFNALLKILEEPPKHVIFILATTEIQKVPITITSRVQKFSFSLAEKSTMLDFLKEISKKEKLSISDKALEIIVKKGGGSFRDSLSLLDQISNLATDNKEIDEKLVNSALGLPEDELISNLLALYTENDLEKISDELKTILNSGVKPEILSSEIITRILENPTKDLLPLLSKLPEVRAPFPEAKLLLAFMPLENTPNTAPSRPNFYLNLRKTPSDSKLKSKETLVDSALNSEAKVSNLSENPLKSPDYFSENKENNSADFEPNSENSSTDSSINSKETASDLSLNSKDFDIETYKTSIKSTSIALGQQLKKCEFSLENDVLEIYPSTKTIKIIIESKHNLALLKKHLPEGYGLNIHDHLDFEKKTKPESPKIAAINDIMGKTEEVKSGGEIPF